MEVAGEHLRLHTGARQNMHWPNVDVLFESLAKVAHRVQAVLLSGMDDDGVEAMRMLRVGGAATIAQDEASSAVWGVPGAAVKVGCAALQLPPARLAEDLCAAVGFAGAPTAPVTELSCVVADGTDGGRSRRRV